MAKVQLTERQIEALLYAINVFEAEFDGYTTSELKDSDVYNDLKVLERVRTKLNEAK